MKKLLIALAVCALALPTANAYATQKQKTDKPKDVVVKSDLKKGYIEVFVYADKK